MVLFFFCSVYCVITQWRNKKMRVEITNHVYGSFDISIDDVIVPVTYNTCFTKGDYCFYTTSTETVGINKDITIDLIINEHQSKIELTVLVYYQHELTQQIRSVLEK